MKELKITLATVVFIFLALAIYTRLAGPIPFSVNSIQTTKNNLFHVQGTGKATAAPDTAIVMVGVTEEGNDVNSLKDSVNKKAEKLIQNIRNLGIAEKDIKTTNYSVNPKYDYSSSRERINGYTVTQTLEIKVKPIDKVNKVNDAATGAGANLVGGTSFGFSDDMQKKLENEAREEAVKNAKEKAESLARAAGIRLGRVVDVVENNNAYPIFDRSLKAMPAPIEGSLPVKETTITPGENNVNVTIELSYETF